MSIDRIRELYSQFCEDDAYAESIAIYTLENAVDAIYNEIKDSCGEELADDFESVVSMIASHYEWNAFKAGCQMAARDDDRELGSRVRCSCGECKDR